MDARVLFHSSIMVSADRTLYFDPFRVADGAPAADVIFITHDHFDHYSLDDISKLMKSETVLVVPRVMEQDVRARFANVVAVAPGESLEVSGVPVETVAAYNVGKAFHPESKGFVGYIVTVEGSRVYVMCDTDSHPDNEGVRCDDVFVPIGGTYTMNAREAAAYVNRIKPRRAIPTHYGEIVGSPSDAAVFAENVDPAVETEVQLYQSQTRKP